MKNNTSPQRVRLMRNLYGLLILLFISFPGFSQNVGINATGALPNASAGLDIDFMNMGLLIPRVALTGTANAAPLTAKVAGMIVYNTTTVSDVRPGFYYNDGINWIAGFPASSSIGDMLYWNGTAWVKIPVGTSGQFLQVSASNLPTWSGAAFSNITTTAVSAITGITATSGGTITTDGGSAVLARGVCWNTVTGPTIANSKTTDGLGVGSYASNLTGLLPGTMYYVKAYSMNSNVITYGNEISFTTSATAPTLGATTAASLITGSTATSGGNVTADGGTPITERGICWATTTNPNTASSGKVSVLNPTPGTGTFICNLTGLSGGMTYYVRAFATNSIGTSYGTQITFVTSVVPPTLVTAAPTNILGATATSGGSMSWNGGGYSNYQDYGVEYSTSATFTTSTKVPTSSSNGSVNIAVPIGPWVTNITGLTSNTAYYIRSYLNLYPSGTGPWTYVYGNVLNFATTGATAPIVGATTAISAINDRSANSGGTITSDGGATITVKGVCWGTTANPVLGTGNFTSNGIGTAAYSSAITGLTGSITYHVRAYATNIIGTSYGTDVSFTTWVAAPYTIGQNLGWGYVASVDATGAGYIVSPDILPTAPATTFTWGCNGTHVAVGTALGTGKTNTDLIIATCGVNTAAGTARAYNGGGYNDWFLPSNSEFQIVASSYTLFGFSGGYTSYFTSSEYGTNYAYASSYFYTGSQAYASGSVRIGDTFTHAIRAMRSFSGFSAPTVSTATVVNISSTGATTGGTIGSDGGTAVTARGVCWNTVTGPTIANSKTTDGTGIGTFTSTMTGLTPGTAYYVRAYATNSAGTTYGNELSIIPLAAVIPTLTTDPISALAATTATSGGNISADGGALLTAYGVCWNTVTAPTITTNAGITNNFATTGPLPLPFASTVTGLVPGTTYYLRAYATTSAGTAYGNEEIFTPSNLPVVSTDPMGSLVGAITEGYYTVTSEGAGGMTAAGLCWGTSVNPTITTNVGMLADPFYVSGSSVGASWPLDITGLTVGIVYHIRAFATNGSGTAYGADVTFTATAAVLGQLVYLNWQNGYVFNIDGTGTHGLIALAYSPGVTADWGCTSTLTGASGIILGTGMTNTTAILSDISTNACASAGPALVFAPQLCQFYDLPNWYLPSKDELNLLWRNRAVDATGSLDALLSTAIGIAPLWSSSEVDATHAWALDGAGVMVNTGLKTDQNNVWPIRSF